MCKTMMPPDDIGELRQAFGQFPTGVAVVSVLDRKGNPLGKTISSFCSVSLNPPLVGWYLGYSARAFNDFALARRFGVTVLAQAQATLAKQFATPAQDQGEFFLPGDNRPPLLKDGAAWFECNNYRNVPAGDHLLILGKIARFETGQPDPLVFARSGFTALAGAASVQV